MTPMTRLKAVFFNATTAGAGLSPDLVMAAGAISSSLSGFGAPAMLWGLLSLPVMWRLMRSTPQKPVDVDFPSITFLFNLISKKTTPLHMPWWQKLNRVTAAGALIVGLAHPGLGDPVLPIGGDGPVILVLGNDWSSGRHWTQRLKYADNIIDRAADAGQKMIVLKTAAGLDGATPGATPVISPAEARTIIHDTHPQPWLSDLAGVAAALDALGAVKPAAILWLGSGFDERGAADLADHLRNLGPLSVIGDAPADAPCILAPAAQDDGVLAVRVQCAAAGDGRNIVLNAVDDFGIKIHQVNVTIPAGTTAGLAIFNPPADQRRRIARIVAEGQGNAAAVLTLDERWRTRNVGMLDTDAVSGRLSLRDEATFITQALQPTQLKRGGVSELLKLNLSVLIQPDAAVMTADLRRSIDEWVAGGGTLLRFAGSTIAGMEVNNSGLLPAPLNTVPRDLPSRNTIQNFDDRSPFYGIAIPPGVSIDRGLFPIHSNHDSAVWARLADGSPLVTGRRHGDGWVVMVHTTANLEWSNMALHGGLFGDMLNAIIATSRGMKTMPVADLPAVKMVDGYGRVAPPLSGAMLSPDAIAAKRFSASSPPGLYGASNVRFAHNLGAAIPELKPLILPGDVAMNYYADINDRTDWMDVLWRIGIALLIIDRAISLSQSGFMRKNPAPGVV